MTLEEFYAEPPKATKPVRKLPTPIVVGPSDDDGSIFDDEMLPEGVFKAYVGGEICYMTSTEDGRIVRLDDWNLPF